MNMKMATFVAVAWIVLGQATAVPPHQQAWVKAFEGTWVPENTQGGNADVAVTITLEKEMLVLKTSVGSRQMQTRYDLSGASLNNSTVGRPAVFKTRFEGEKIVTDIWDAAEAVGPPTRTETRYLASPDRMVGEVRNVSDGRIATQGALVRRK
jgi:hypothetical protein